MARVVRRLLTAQVIAIAMVAAVANSGLAADPAVAKEAFGSFIEGAKGRVFHDQVSTKVRWAAAAKLSVTDAIKAATDKVSGKVIEAELEAENGVLVWEVEIVTAENKLATVLVDPQSGVTIVGQPIPATEGMKESK